MARDRAEIIGGLKKQGFLIAQGKHIVPTEAGLSLFGVLKQADPALVDPGVTAQLECLLDDVVVGKQEMVGAIDAVCNVAERIIGKLKGTGAAGGPPLLGATVGNGQPTPAMKRFADSLALQKGIKPPPGYKTSISICRKFLSEHAPKKAESETPGKLDSKPVSPAQMLYAKKIAQGKGVVIPEEAKANSAAMSAWIDSNRSAKRRRRGRRRISCASIDGDDEEVSETQTRRLCGSTGSRAAKFGYRYAAADSLWQQEGRSEAWRPLSLGWKVCPTWS